MGFRNCLSFVCFVLLCVEPPHVHTSSCDDEPTMICPDLHRVKADMCNEHCIAELCKKTCGKCQTTQAPPSVLECYQCAEMDRPDNCTTTVSCPGNKSCIITQTFTANLEEKFQSGCVDNQVCQNLYQSIPKPGTPFKRSITFHGGCCASHLCNKIDPDVQKTNRMRRQGLPGAPGHDGEGGHAGRTGHDGGGGHAGQTSHDGEGGHAGQSGLPGSPGIPGTNGESGNSGSGGTSGHLGSSGTSLSSSHGPSIDGCVDVERNYCQSQANSKLCQLKCFENLCPESCNLCVSCYNCSHEKNPEDCKTIAKCNKGEVCLTVESVSPQFTSGWKTACSTVDRCKALNFTVDGEPSVNSHFDGYCCSHSHCNNISVPSPSTVHHNAATTFYIAPSINTNVNPYAARCHLTFSGPCPKDFIEIGQSCYYFGKKNETMNMTDAQQLCRKRCTRLFIISDHLEANRLTEYIQRNIPNLFDADTAFWTDAMKTIKHGHISHSRWVSNSTGASLSYHHFDGSPDHRNPDGEMCMDFGPYETLDARHHEYYVDDRSCTHTTQRPMCEYSNNNKL